LIAAQDQLELSRDEYLRQQDAWETGSMASTAVDATPVYRDPAKSELFNQQRQQYLHHGPDGGHGQDLELDPPAYGVQDSQE
jgi:hypothetical protein